MKAVITGASTGIGYQLAVEFASRGYDLVICANEPEIRTAASALRDFGVHVDAIEVDLATPEGVTEFAQALGDVPDILCLNAGTVVYGDFMRSSKLEDQLRLVRLNVESVVHLSKLVVPKMVSAGGGRVLITASIAALMPGPLYSTYAASKAFLLSFSEAIRNELSGTGVTVTCLMPGPTDTPIFERAGMSDTVVGHGPKDDPVMVARDAVNALMNGEDHVVSHSLFAKVSAIGARFLPERMLAFMHRQQTRPLH